jgi:hypothetical protein
MRSFKGWCVQDAPNKWEAVMRICICILLAALAAGTAGCMSDTKSGRSFTYDCSGAGKGWGDCHQKADAQCGANNYTVVSGEGDATAKAPGGNTEMKRTLVVTCR